MEEGKARLAAAQQALRAQLDELAAEERAGALGGGGFVGEWGALSSARFSSASLALTHTAPGPSRPLAGAAAQRRIAAGERRLKALYDSLTAGQAAAAEAEAAADLLANDVGGAADEAARQAAVCGHLRAEVARWGAAVEAAQANLEAARVRAALEARHLGGLQAQLAELEALRAEKQRRGEALERELAALGKQQFRAAQALAAARDEGRRLASELAGARTQGRNLSQRIVVLEEQLARQQARGGGSRQWGRRRAQLAALDCLTHPFPSPRLAPLRPKRHPCCAGGPVRL